MVELFVKYDWYLNEVFCSCAVFLDYRSVYWSNTRTLAPFVTWVFFFAVTGAGKKVYITTRLGR